MKKKKEITAEKKVQIVLEVLREDKPLTEIANEYGIQQAQLSKWKQDFLENMLMLFKKKVMNINGVFSH